MHLMCPKGLTHSGWEGVCRASPAGCTAACPASISWVGVGVSVRGDNWKRVPLLPRWGVTGQRSWVAVWLGQNNSSPQRALGHSRGRAEAPQSHRNADCSLAQSNAGGSSGPTQAFLRVAHGAHISQSHSDLSSGCGGRSRPLREEQAFLTWGISDSPSPGPCRWGWGLPQKRCSRWLQLWHPVWIRGKSSRFRKPIPGLPSDQSFEK